MLDCLLVNSPDEFYSGDYAADPKVPLGLLYIAAYLKLHGHTAAILDCHANAYTKADVLKLAAEHQARIVGLNITTPNRRVVFDLAMALKATLPDTPVIVGGSHATSLPEDVFAHAPDIDAVVVGEGELTVLRIIESLPSIPAISGVYTWDDFQNRRPKTYSPRLHDLDSLPFSDFSLLDLKKYLGVTPELYMTCSRGCIYDCAFCSIRTLLGKGISSRSASNVLAEMHDLRSRYGVERFYFYDDDLLLWPGVDEFSSLNAGTGNRWTGQGTLNDVRGEDQVAALAAAHCYRLSFGFESGSYRLQKYIAKVVKGRSLALLPHFTKHGIHTRGYFILGFPQEEMEDVVETMLYLTRLRELGLSDISVFPARPYPGTRLFEHCVRTFGAERIDELLDFHYVDDWAVQENDVLREKLRRYNTLPSFQINERFTPHQIRELITLANETFFRPEIYHGLSRDALRAIVEERGGLTLAVA
jgi:anaerobic magnesium-protoporphyrin IX monomethyl ester cyclase